MSNVNGPMGSGKMALIEVLTRKMAARYKIGSITRLAKGDCAVCLFENRTQTLQIISDQILASAQVAWG